VSKKLIKGVQTAFIADIKAGVKTSDLVTKYGFPNRGKLYQTMYYLRKTGVLPKRKHNTAKKATAVAKPLSFKLFKTVMPESKTVDNTKSTNFRTVYLQDFSIQIHKKANSRVVVDENNNIHILNN
jgi:hypothetical protein